MRGRAGRGERADRAFSIVLSQSGLPVDVAPAPSNNGLRTRLRSDTSVPRPKHHPLRRRRLAAKAHGGLVFSACRLFPGQSSSTSG